MMTEYAYLFKNIIIGDTNVGKSCLMLQFIEGRFKPSLDPTVGVEFASRTCLIRDQPVKLQIWDTAGQESFKSITRSYFRGAIGALVVFDITNEESFRNVNRWLQEIINGTSKSIVILLVGNKADLADQRKVSREEAERLAASHRIEYIEVSAKNGENVHQAFERVASRILEGIESGQIDPMNEFGIKLGNARSEEQRPRTNTSRGTNNSGCC